MKITLQNRIKNLKINILLICVTSMLTLGCSSNNDDEEEQIPDIEIPSEETPQEKILGTWEVNVYYNDNDDPEDKRTYTFFDDGFYAYNAEGDDGEGEYTISDRTIKLDGEKATLDIITDNVIDFTLEEYRYKGKRIIKPNSELSAENKMKLVGTWVCDITTTYDGETSQLTIKDDGKFINDYIEYDNDKYIGWYHISGDIIYFEEPMGKDPIGGFYLIKKLANNQLYLKEMYYDGYISAQKSKN